MSIATNEPHRLDQTPAHTMGGAHTHRRISWAAIFGSVLIVVALQLLLSALGIGIGLGSINVNAGTTPSASTFGIGAGIWWVVESCFALFVGGYIAAWLAGIEIRFDGILHGLVTWSIAMLLTIYLLSTAVGGIIGGGFSALGSLVSATGSGISQIAKPLAQATGISPEMVQDQVKSYLQPAASADPATMSPQDAQKEVASNLVTYARGGADAPAAKERVIAIMAAQLKISHEAAAKKFDEAQAKLQQTKDQAIETAKTAADATAGAASRTSFAIFGMLLLGAISAGLGGSLAVQRRATTARQPLRTGV